ncbi:MAG: protein phosphatase 2C domain-containing protein [Rhodospirillales bacterium]|nr:protein phosphatase 2C domain-containing protein [Acetobacter sp.]
MGLPASWHCVGASVLGTSHRQTGKPCQDYCSWQFATLGEEAVAIIALADGAGSAARSEEGSRLVVETLLHEASRYEGSPKQITDDDAAEWLHNVRRTIEAHAIEEGCAVDAFHATALLAVLGEMRSVFVQVGDGGWVVEDKEGFRAATWPQTGEYANVTVFVTSDDALAKMQFVVIDEEITAVAGFTDGVQSMCLDLAARNPHAPFFDRVFAPLHTCKDASDLHAPLIVLLDSAVVNQRTDDDKTLVLACRNPGGSPVSEPEVPPPSADATMG